jgi:hypothetical protein
VLIVGSDLGSWKERNVLNIAMQVCNIAAITDDSMVLLQDCMDLEKDVSGSHIEASPSSPHSIDQTVHIKVEESSHMQDEDHPVPTVSISHSQAECVLSFSSASLMQNVSSPVDR